MAGNFMQNRCDLIFKSLSNLPFIKLEAFNITYLLERRFINNHRVCRLLDFYILFYMLYSLGLNVHLGQ